MRSSFEAVRLTARQGYFVVSFAPHPVNPAAEARPRNRPRSRYGDTIQNARRMPPQARDMPILYCVPETSQAAPSPLRSFAQSRIPHADRRKWVGTGCSYSYTVAAVTTSAACLHGLLFAGCRQSSAHAAIASKNEERSRFSHSCLFSGSCSSARS